MKGLPAVGGEVMGTSLSSASSSNTENEFAIFSISLLLPICFCLSEVNNFGAV